MSNKVDTKRTVTTGTTAVDVTPALSDDVSALVYNVRIENKDTVSHTYTVSLYDQTNTDTIYTSGSIAANGFYEPMKDTNYVHRSIPLNGRTAADTTLRVTVDANATTTESVVIVDYGTFA